MRRWTIPLAVSLGLVVVWWTHKLLTYYFPPFECPADIALLIVGSVLKLATIICIPLALSRVFAHCQGNLRQTAKAVAVWGIALVVVLVVLSALRGPLATMLNNDASRFYPTSMGSPKSAQGFGEQLKQQVANWQSGRTFLSEFGIILSCALSLCVFAFVSRGGKLVWGIGATLWLGFLIFGTDLAFGLLVGDYDFFFGATMTAPLSLDISFPFAAGDPSTEIGSLVYLVLIWSSWLLDAFVLRRGAELASGPTHAPAAVP